MLSDEIFLGICLLSCHIVARFHSLKLTREWIICQREDGLILIRVAFVQQNQRQSIANARDKTLHHIEQHEQRDIWVIAFQAILVKVQTFVTSVVHCFVTIFTIFHIFYKLSRARSVFVISLIWSSSLNWVQYLWETERTTTRDNTQCDLSINRMHICTVNYARRRWWATFTREKILRSCPTLSRAIVWKIIIIVKLKFAHSQ